MIKIILFYLIALAFMLPPLIKYKHKGALVAFSIMFVLALTYSILSELDVPLDGVPLFFSKLIRNWGISYPGIKQ